MPLKPEDLLALDPEEEEDVSRLEIIIDACLRANWRPGECLDIELGEVTWRVVQRLMNTYRVLGWQVNPTCRPSEGSQGLNFREKPPPPEWQGRTDWP